MQGKRIGRFELGPILSKGVNSEVYVGWEASDKDKKYAVKVIDTAELSEKDRELLNNERERLKEIDHPCVVRYFETVEEDGKMYLFMELLQGGGLYESIIQREHYTEADAQRVLKSVAEALKHFHAKGRVHGNLNLGDVLLCSTQSDSDVKVAGFGFVRVSDGRLSAPSPNFVAPEVLAKRPYHAPVDMWAFGVIAYILLCGYYPFDGETSKETLSLVKSGTYSFDPDSWSHISEKARDMIRQLLKLDPSKRLTAEEVLNHPWMTGEAVGNADLTSALKGLRGTLTQRKPNGSESANPILNKPSQRRRTMSEIKPITPSTSSKNEKKDKQRALAKRKPKPMHPLDLDLFKVALLPLVTSVGLTIVLHFLSHPGTAHSGGVTPFDVVYEIVWGCNIALLLSGVGIATNRPMMVGTAICVVAVDQLCWYIDVLGYFLTGKFPVGVAKYMTAPTTTWVHAITGTHHLWFIPVGIFWLSAHGGVPHGSYWGSVATTSVIASLARLFTPFAVRQGLNAQEVRVWNINLAYEFYEDVAIPILHIMDHKPPHQYLPFLILVCNFILNVVPCAVVIALSRLPFGGKLSEVDDWLPNFNLDFFAGAANAL